MANNTTSTETSTVWDINTDIYDISSTVNNVKNRYIDDVNEDTLSLGIFGFISDVESKKIQTATIMSAQLGNELFPARAKLTKNILAHAIYNNITDINAVPAIMTINIGIKVSDLDDYFKEHQDTNKFIFDSTCPIFIEDIEFHFEYDIILARTQASGMVETSYVYSAHYDMEDKNRVSKITDPYLKQPFQIHMVNDDYVVFQADIRQYTIEETSDKIISDSIIENKTFTFEFSNQLADFDVYVTTEGIKTRLIPILYGGEILDDPDAKYCWYFFISDNTIRITFDSASYSPGLNSDILVRAFTTLGENGNFEYKKYDSEEGGLYVDLESEKYGYDRIQCLAFLVTDSHWGENSKSKEELQQLIPKMAHSRSGITTEQDVLDYFNLISTDTNRLVMRKKVDNQFARTWYAFFLLKDDNNNVLPTNTIDLLVPVDLDPSQDQPTEGVIISEDGRFVVPAGTILKLKWFPPLIPEEIGKWRAEIYPKDTLEEYDDELPLEGNPNHIIYVKKSANKWFRWNIINNESLDGEYIEILEEYKTKNDFPRPGTTNYIYSEKLSDKWYKCKWYEWDTVLNDYIEITDKSETSIKLIPDPYSPEYYNAGYFYTLLHNVMITEDPLYTAFYMTTTNKERLFTYEWINEKCILQFVANKIKFKRSLLENPNFYMSTFRLAQSINDPTYIDDQFTPDPLDPTGETGTHNINMKVVFLLYNRNGSPYRWVEAKMPDKKSAYDEDNLVSTWELNLETDNGFDDNNDIKILNLHEYESTSTSVMHGYFPADTKCRMYVLVRMLDGRVIGDRYGIDDIAPGYFTNYTVTNVYNIDNGFLFYDNYTNIMNARTTTELIDPEHPNLVTYLIEGIPVGGSHYMADEDMAQYFISKIDEKKDYIKGCLARLENNMDIDFKFFNTYGPSKTYTTDIEGTQSIGHIDMTMKFKLKLKSASDIYTKDDIVNFVKNYIENLEDIGDLHIPNLITDITNEFSTRIVYIEFVSFNNFPLGIQHALVHEGDIDTIPEFINIRNIKTDSGFYPSIDIETVN